MDTRTTRPMTNRQRAKALTRQKVLSAAREAFIEHGYLKATIRDIAKIAGMSTGAFFASFESKEACLEAIIAEEHAEEFQLFTATRFTSRYLTESLRSMFALSYERWERERGLLRAWMTQLWDGHEALEALTQSYEKKVHEILMSIFVHHEVHDYARLAMVIVSLHMENLRYLGVGHEHNAAMAQVRLGIQLELLITRGQHLGPGCA